MPYFYQCEDEASSLLGEDSFLGICFPTKLPQSEPGGDFFFGERERVGGAPTPSSPRPRPPPLLVHKGTLCASCTRMADTRGSTSSGGGDDRGREGHDDFTGGGQYNRYHRILEAVPSPLVRRENGVHHQYPTGLIHHPSSTMPVAPCSYVPRYTMVPTSAMLPLQHHHRQLQISQG